MPRLTRLTSQYVRRELQRIFRDKYLSAVARHIVAQRADGGGRWEPFRIMFDVESMRPMIEAMEALPRARIERKPASLLRDYQRELTIWKRRRTHARARVAKYARLVRYHSKPPKKRGGGGSPHGTRPRGAQGWVRVRELVRGERVLVGGPIKTIK